MKVTILGTGTFNISKENSGPGYLVRAGKKLILVDCGPGTLLRLSELGIKPEELDYIFLTHFHADHTSDLFALQMSLRLKEFEKVEYKTPIIYGPKGIKEFTKKLSTLYELPAFDDYEKIIYKEFLDLIDLDDLRIKTFPVKHVAFGKEASAYALRFEFGDEILAFSGDTVLCEGLKKASDRADLFICDSSYPKGMRNLAHMDAGEIGEIANEMKVKRVVLTHIYPSSFKFNLVEQVKEKFGGDVVVGNDLMELEI